jgi:tetratricopeptide (TPR) repeat protein
VRNQLRTTRVLRILGQIAADSGQPRRAYRWAKAAYRQQPSDGRLMTLLSYDLGMLLLQLGRGAEAQPLLEQTYARWSQLHEPKRDEHGVCWHQDVAAAMIGLGQLGLHNGDIAGAETMLTQAARIQEVVMGEDALEYGEALNALSEIFLQRGRWQECEQVLDRAERCLRSIFKTTIKLPLIALELRRARLAAARGHFALAEQGCTATCAASASIGAPEHVLALWATVLKADMARRQGRSEEAAQLWQWVLPRLRRALPDHPTVLRLLRLGSDAAIHTLDIPLYG